MPTDQVAINLSINDIKLLNASCVFLLNEEKNVLFALNLVQRNVFPMKAECNELLAISAKLTAINMFTSLDWC